MGWGSVISSVRHAVEKGTSMCQSEDLSRIYIGDIFRRED